MKRKYAQEYAEYRALRRNAIAHGFNHTASAITRYLGALRKLWRTA